MPLFDSKRLGLRSLFSCRRLDYVIVNALIRARACKASFVFSLLSLELTQELITVCLLSPQDLHLFCRLELSALAFFG